MLLSGCAGLVGLSLLQKSPAAETSTPKIKAYSVNIADFGAVGDGVADDSAAIAAAIDFCVRFDLRHVIFPAGTYKTSKPILIHSKIMYSADGVVEIIQNSADAPIMQSPAGEGISPRGQVRISGGFILHGNPQHTKNHGIFIHDYYSNIDGIEIYNCGGHGIFFSETSYSGHRPSGNLVENKISNVKIFGTSKSAIRIGVNPNSKLTDGLLQNIIINSSTTEPSIFINAGAGWIIQNIHTYGKTAPFTAIYLANGHFTIMQNAYIEGFQKYGIMCASTQTAITLQNIMMKTGAIQNGKAGAIHFSTAKSDEEVPLCLGNFVIHHKKNQQMKKIVIGKGSPILAATGIVVAGPFSNLVE